MPDKFITTTSLNEVILPNLKQKIKDYLNPCFDITSLQTPDEEGVNPDDWRIDTGLTLNYGYKYEVKAKNDISYSNASLIDSGTADTSITANQRPRMGFVVYNKATPRIQAWIKGSGSQDYFREDSGANIDWEQDYTVTLDKTGMTIVQGDTNLSDTWKNTPATGTDNYPIYLLFNPALNSTASGVSYGPTTIYYIKIYDEQGELIRNFVPTYNRAIAKYGMYDKVEGKFYLPKRELTGTR